MEPGQTVTPEQNKPEAEATQVVADSVVEQPSVAAPEKSTPEPVVGWDYAADQTAATPSSASSVQPVNWTASEFVAHAKGAAWFGLLALAIVIVTIVVFILTRDMLATAMVAIAGILFGVFSARQPRVLEYSVNDKGVQIGQRFYSYQEFRSFVMSDDGPLPSVHLIPFKRFLPPITVFYEPQTEDAIMAVLTSYLPFEQKQTDIVDRLMSRIRF